MIRLIVFSFPVFSVRVLNVVELIRTHVSKLSISLGAGVCYSVNLK